MLESMKIYASEFKFWIDERRSSNFNKNLSNCSCGVVFGRGPFDLYTQDSNNDLLSGYVARMVRASIILFSK
jgi:hypothetical protein